MQGLLIHPRADIQMHQQFVDDAMLMGHPFIQKSKKIKLFLDNFGKDSGLEVNELKSHIFFFHTPRVTGSNICPILGFQECSLPSKYLGASLADSKAQKISWYELLDKMRKIISNWTLRPLNFASRLVLVKVVLQAMPVYFFYPGIPKRDFERK